MKPGGSEAANRRKQQAYALFQQGQLQHAKKLYLKLGRDHPNDAETSYMLGSIHAQEGDFKTAILHFRQATVLQPDAVPAHCGLGAALKASGKHTESETSFRHALQLQPNQPAVLLELAGILLGQKKTSEAEDCLQQLLRIQPGSAEAHHNLGEIRLARGDCQAAIQHFRQAMKNNPELAETHNRLGYALFQQGQLQEAITHCRQALRLKPGLLEAHRNLGAALMLAGQLDESEAAYNNALRLKPDYLDAIAGIAAVYEQQGNFQVAIDRVAPLIEGDGARHTGLATIYARLCPRLGRHHDAIQHLEQLLAEHTFPAATQEQLHFELGKLHDSRGSYDKAFQHYQEANELKTHPFDVAQHEIYINALMQVLNREFLASAPRAKHQSELPLFIIGMPRSGTSLVEQILASHPKVYGAGELKDISEYAESLCARLGGGPEYPYCLPSLSQAVVNSLSDSYTARLAQMAPDALRVTDKMPQNFLHLGLIALLFPGARVVHCIRNGYDTCLSIYFQNFPGQPYANDLETIGSYYRLYEKLMRYWYNVLDIKILEVRYEDMIENQEEMTRRLVDFTGLEWDPRCLAFHKTRRTVSTASYDQVRRPLYASSVGRWKHYEKHLGPLFRSLGNPTPHDITQKS